MKSIAVVLLNWNGLDLLRKFLPTIVQYSPEAVVYVADNASTDLSKQFVQEHYPEVRWIQLLHNYGYAGGYNEALREVEEEILCLVNTDIEVTENWLLPVMDVFNKRKEVGIIQPKILDYNNKEYFEYAGAAGGFIDQYGFPFCRGRVFDTLEKDTGQYPSQLIFWASGACFFIRNAVFRELNGFDSDFFAHQEEIDLCWRAFNSSINVFYCGESAVYHVGGATLGKSDPAKTYLNFRNSLYMLYKNLPKQKRFPIIFKRLCLDGIAGIRFLLEFKPMHTIAVIKAHFAYYAHLKSLKLKQSHTTKAHYYHTPNIVWSYFFRKRKTFPAL